MSIVMNIKHVLRRFGLDVIKYHSFWDDIAPKLNINTVLDIGANEGHFSASMRERFPDAQIYAFEPLRDCFDKMNKQMGGDIKFKSWNVALGEAKIETVINRSASHPSSSLLPMAGIHKTLYPGSVEHTEETIRVERLDDLMSGQEILPNCLVKIDVQGFEASVIKGGAETLKRSNVVVVENSFVTLYEGQALFSEIHNLLTELGFSYRGRSETHYDPKTKESIYEDSIFIKI